MNPSEIQAITPYDLDLAAIPDLTWLPWVGQNYADLAPGRKVLIVGESHYSSKEDPVDSAEEIASYLNDPNSTREMVEGALINWTWPHISTLANLHQLLFSPGNPEEFWGELCYYNFIQRPMRYRTTPPERPTWED
ncbi:MAG: hypothetical protein KC931_21500, partial [Candidatus Omnitrophica bacterium]|nr:hypothetical protein [Candidatus Omnitrophota bacterium]